MVTKERVFWLLIAALWAIAALCLIAACKADAQPFEAIVHEPANLYRNRITITLRDPITDELLGVYEAVSGGLGRGSAPFGEYQIGKPRSDGWIGPRWELHRPGFHPRPGFSAFDRRIGKMRTWLQLHSMHGFNQGTFGCIGVFGGPDVWATFRKQLNHILSIIGVVRFELRALPQWVRA